MKPQKSSQILERSRKSLKKSQRILEGSSKFAPPRFISKNPGRIVKSCRSFNSKNPENIFPKKILTESSTVASISFQRSQRPGSGLSKIPASHQTSQFHIPKNPATDPAADPGTTTPTRTKRPPPLKVPISNNWQTILHPLPLPENPAQPILGHVPPSEMNLRWYRPCRRPAAIHLNRNIIEKECVTIRH